MKPEKHFIILHESYTAMLANNAITFWVLAAMFWVNQEYLSGAIPEWVLSVLFALVVFSKTSFVKKKVATNKADAIAAVNEFYGAD